MNIATTKLSPRKRIQHRTTAVLALALVATALAAPAAYGQLAHTGEAHFLTGAALPATLPDAPGFLPSQPAASSSSLMDSTIPAASDASPYSSVPPHASHFDKYIEPGQTAPTITAGDKILLGLRDASSLSALGGWILAAGYEQATNGSPNYGTNSTAFAKRFGASAARASSEGVFSDSVMASVLREDPRYYRMGPGHSPIKRLTYSVTRVFITRTDSGRSTVNLALLSGNLGGSYLTKAYYPALNTSNTEVFKTFGGSIGGSALGFAVSEFFGGFINHIGLHTRRD